MKTKQDEMASGDAPKITPKDIRDSVALVCGQAKSQPQRLLESIIPNQSVEETPLYKREFPNFEMDFLLPSSFEDVSWHHDSCPCWQSDLLRLRLHAYGPNKDEWFDEDIAEHRFYLSRFNPGDELAGFDYVMSDDFNEIKQAIFANARGMLAAEMAATNPDLQLVNQLELVLE